MRWIMKPKKSKDSAAEFEKGTKKTGKQHYILKLYIAGMTPKSKRAILKIKELCDGQLKDRYELQIIDILRKPVLASGEQIIATPTLIRKLPLPIQKFIGDMTEAERILIGVDLMKKS